MDKNPENCPYYQYLHQQQRQQCQGKNKCHLYRYLLSREPERPQLYEGWSDVVRVRVEIHGAGNHVQEYIDQGTGCPLNPRKRAQSRPVQDRYPHVTLGQPDPSLGEKPGLELDGHASSSGGE